MDYYSFPFLAKKAEMSSFYKQEHQGTMRYQGLSLLELMITLAIVIILAVLATPSFLSFIQQYRLTSTIQGLYYNLQYARSEAIKRGSSIYVSFQTGSSWCYGINNGSACNCSNPTSCALGTYTSPSTLTTLTLSGFNSLIFESSRGAANASGTITLTVTGGVKSMGIDIGTMGNLQLCSNNISGYPVC
ncbi:MAG TPA: GspH/FimT family pseudopilin [Gammaproteobacteria bacterium]|nr:GspH/FimT family pseudopilin [Gammaproteobacteria bacterium]